MFTVYLISSHTFLSFTSKAFSMMRASQQRSRGSIFTSLSSTTLGVHLYPPVICLKHLFWILLSFYILAFICLPFSPVFQTYTLYTITGLTIAVYSSLILIIYGPQVITATYKRALKAAVPFPAIIFVYSFQFILGSSHIPSTLSFISGLISSKKPLIFIVLTRSLFRFLFYLVKCMSLYLSGVNFKPCLLDQSIHFSCTSLRCLQFSQAESPHVIMFVSSMNLKPSFFSLMLYMPSRSSNIKKKNRIGEIGDPWGIPEFV